MNDVTDNLGKDLGPLPVWVWGAGIGAVVVGVMYFRNRSSNKAVTTAGASVTDPTVAAQSGLNAFSAAYSGAGGGLNTTPTTTDQTATNALWLRQAMIWGSGNGLGSMTTIETALKAYLNGNALTSAQDSIVNAILSAVGQPPEGSQYTGGTAYSAEELQAIKDAAAAKEKTLQDALDAANKAKVTTPAPVNTPVPMTAENSYTVQRGDSLSSIGARVGMSWQRLYELNRDSIRNPNLIYAGQILNLT